MNPKSQIYRFVAAFYFVLFPSLTVIFPNYDDSPIQVSSTSVENNFPEGITFTAEAQSMEEIVQVKFIHHLQAAISRQVEYLEIEPSTLMTIRYHWNTSRFTVAPSSKIFFQWELKDTVGNVITTPEEECYYDDIRFEWKELSDEDIFVRWYDGEFSFGEKTFQVARDALSMMESNTGQKLEFPIIVLLYANDEDFQSWHYYVEEWVAGQAFSSLGVTAQIVPTGVQMEWINEVIPHEIAHLFFYQSIHSVWANWPPWLNEGLAQYYEFNSQDADLELAAQAAKSGDLIPLMDLDVDIGLGRDPDEVHLAYAESISVVTFIIETYGDQSIQKLIEAFREGIDTRAAIQEALGISWEEFEAEWITWMGVPATPMPSPQPTQPLKPPTYPPPSYSNPTPNPTASESVKWDVTPTSKDPEVTEESSGDNNKSFPNLCGGMIVSMLVAVLFGYLRWIHFLKY